MYRLTFIEKIATLDDYNDGEVGKSYINTVDIDFTGDTVETVVKKAIEFIGGDTDCFSTDIDGEIGRIDFQTIECEDGTIPSKSETELWRSGKLELWACYYIASIEKSTPVNLTKEKIQL